MEKGEAYTTHLSPCCTHSLNSFILEHTIVDIYHKWCECMSFECLNLSNRIKLSAFYASRCSIVNHMHVHNQLRLLSDLVFMNIFATLRYMHETFFLSKGNDEDKCDWKMERFAELLKL